MALVDRLQIVQDRLMQLPTKFGDPRYKQISYVHPTLGTVLIVPNPKVETIPGYLAAKYMASGVEISKDDLLVSDVSRSYPFEVLKKSRYLIDTQRLELIDVIETEMLSYGLVLRKIRGK